MPFPLAELVLRGSGLVPDFRVFQFDAATNLSILTKYLQQITTSWKHRHFLETPTFLLTTRPMIFWSEPVLCAAVQEEVDKHTGQPGAADTGQPGAAARRWGCCARSRWRLQGLLRPLLPRDRTRESCRPARHRPRGRSCLSQHASRRPSANSISRTPVRHRSDSVRMLLLWAL